MAGKISPLTWTAPPDGGSPITGYRVLVYEGTNLVGTLTPTVASLQVTASETVSRTALIQARNALGYSRPLRVTIPAGVAGSTTPTPTVPTLQITKLSDSSARFTLSSVPSDATQYELYAIGYPNQQEDEPPLLEQYTGTAPPFTLSLPGYEAYFVTGVRWIMKIYYPTGDPVSTAKTAMPAIASTTPTTPATGPHLVDAAVLYTVDGYSSYDTLGKDATSNEKTLFATLPVPNEAYANPSFTVTWFKFQVTGAARTIEITGLPSRVGFNAGGSSGSDTALMLFSATSGAVTDATIATALTFIVRDDDSAGQNQPYVSSSLSPGWYYVGVGSFTPNPGSRISDGRYAMRGLPAATTTTYNFDDQGDLNAFDYTPSFASSAVTPSSVSNSRLAVSGNYAVINRIVSDRSVTRRYEWEGFDRLNAVNQGGMRWNIVSTRSFWMMDGSALGYFLDGNFNSVASVATMPNGDGARMAIEIDPDATFRIYRSEGGNPLTLAYTGTMAGTGLPYTSGTAGVWGSNCSVATAVVPSTS